MEDCLREEEVDSLREEQEDSPREEEADSLREEDRGQPWRRGQSKRIGGQY